MHTFLYCCCKVGIGSDGVEIVQVDIRVVSAEAAECGGAGHYRLLRSSDGVEAGEVGYRVTIEAPLLAEDGVLYGIVCARCHHTDTVVRRHGAECALCAVEVIGFARCDRVVHLGGAALAGERLIEVAELEFACGLLVEKFANARTVGFLSVEADVLDVYKAALALCALNYGAAGEAGEDGVFGVVLYVTSVVSRAVNVHAGAYHYGKLIEKGGLAYNELTVFICKNFIPCVRKVYGSGSDTGAYPAIFCSVFKRNAVFLGFRHVVRVGTAGAVVCSIAADIGNSAAIGIFAEAYRRNIFKVMECAGHEVDYFGKRDLGNKLVPSFIIKFSACHICKGKVNGRIAVYEQIDVFLAVICLEIDKVVLHYLFKTGAFLNAPAGVRLGEGAVPVCTGEINYFFKAAYVVAPSVGIGGIVALGELVGDLNAGIGRYREGFGIERGESPGCNLALGACGVCGAVGVYHAGNALLGEYVVECVVRRFADCEVICTCIHYEGFGVLIIVACKVRHIDV